MKVRIKDKEIELFYRYCWKGYGTKKVILEINFDIEYYQLTHDTQFFDYLEELESSEEKQMALHEKFYVIFEDRVLRYIKKI